MASGETLAAAGIMRDKYTEYIYNDISKQRTLLLCDAASKAISINIKSKITGVVSSKTNMVHL